MQRERDGFQGTVRVAKLPQPTTEECVRIRHRMILTMSSQGYSSRVIGTVLNIEPEVVRQTRSRLRRKAEAMRDKLDGQAKLVG